jgi:hypothetical protein
MSIDSDTHVIEGRNHRGEWEEIAFIGPDRAEGVLDEYNQQAYRLCDLRLRSLKPEAEA